MISAALFAALLVLIVFEKEKLINLSNLGGCIFMIASVSAVAGLYIYEWLCIIIRALAKFITPKNDDTHLIENLMTIDMSRENLVLRLILQIVLFVPFAAAFIYIIQHIVRKPLARRDTETDSEYCERCILRLLTLGIITALLFFAGFVAMILLAIPYLDKLKDTALAYFNPLIAFFAIVFTGGLLLVGLAIVFVIQNSTIIILTVSIGLFCTALYLFSLVFGIASAVRAKKIGRLTSSQAVIYSLLSFLMGWNFAVYLVMRKKLKENQACQ